MKFSACGIEDMPKYENSPEYVILHIEYVKDGNRKQKTFMLPWNTTWHHLEQFIQKITDPLPVQSITYVDEEGDTIPVSSDAEWQEALKVAKNNNMTLTLNFQVSQEVGDFLSRKDASSVNEIRSSLNEPSEDGSLIEVEGARSNVYSVLREEEQYSVINSQTDLGEEDFRECPPMWFTVYMESFKKDVISEITKKVCHKLQKLVFSEELNYKEKRFQDGVESDVENKFDVQNVDHNQTSQDKAPNECMGLVNHCVTCCGCNKDIVGIRYKCGNCIEFNLCETCEANSYGIHDSTHVFLKIRKPSITFGSEKKRGKSCPLLKRTIYAKEGSLGVRRKYSEKRKHWEKCYEKNLQKSLHQAASVELGATKLKHYSNKHESYSGISPRLNLLRPVRSIMNAEFLYDETIPDGTKFLPGVKFTKRWRVRNSGLQQWDVDTKLKFLWGTKGFLPDPLLVDVPPLLPKEDGYISVNYVAPVRPGYYESHWNFLHKGHLFGHRIWCSIEVVDPTSTVGKSNETSDCRETKDPEYGENCMLDEAPVWINKEPVVSCGTESSDVSHESTAALLASSSASRPEPPEEVKLESNDDASQEKEQVRDSDLGSVISLSSEDEHEYVVVPLPPCFNIPAFPNLEEKFLQSSPLSLRTDIPRNSSSSCSSVAFIRSDNEESPVASQSNGSSSPVDESCKINEDHAYALPQGSTPAAQCDVPLASNVITQQNACYTYNDAVAFLEEEHKTPVDSSGASDGSFRIDGHFTASQMSSTSTESLLSAEDSESTLHSPVCGEISNQPSDSSDLQEKPSIVTQQPDGSQQMRVVDNVPSIYREEEDQERVVHVLPEGLVSAAASIINSARSAWSAFQWVPMPPDDGSQTTGRYPTRPMNRFQMPHPTNGPSSELSSYLWEMGFCNSVMNATAIAKHHGNLEKVIDDLLQQTDNDWYSHRH